MEGRLPATRRRLVPHVVVAQRDLDNATAPQLRKAVDHLPLTAGQLLAWTSAAWSSATPAASPPCWPAGTWPSNSAATALAAVPANTARILAVVGLGRVFTIHPDTATATAPRSAAS
ncbi:anti-anti-sigma factor [Streptomyces sp. WAC01280]|uniref:anti-anti-sigma factor n=1 Tax=Streptomyces sp. WAC01280 TaxID=2487424 RepID=UPI0021AEDCBA|nr:anti-anti-sigma factor [Streptomyces sp. WAC01280]